MTTKDQIALAELYMEGLSHPGGTITDEDGNIWHISRDEDGTFFVTLEGDNVPDVVESGSSYKEALQRAKSKLNSIIDYEIRQRQYTNNPYSFEGDEMWEP